MPQDIQFPRDEQAHPTIVEWWYLNGHLHASDGSRFQFMTCLFKAQPNKIKLPFFKYIPLKTAYFIHEIVTDLQTKRTYRTIVPLALATPDSFTRPLLHVQAAGWTLTEQQPFAYALTTPHLALALQSKKPPLLENQTGYIDLRVKDTYYYSLTRLAVRGNITLGDRTIPVDDGVAWFDHQWANCGWQPSDDIWTWFSLQLENGCEIVAFRYGGKIVTEMATASFQDGTTKTTPTLHFTPLGTTWRSGQTGAAYSLAWRVRLPEFNLDVTVQPLHERQEMVFGVLNYWEGGLKVNGTCNGQPVHGVGFLELAGVPIATTRRRMFEQALQDAVKKSYRQIERRFRHAAQHQVQSLQRLVHWRKKR
ncbi:MAG: lipocalin family protein [Patescibacteria group bacterium]|nr:lipocalin family protein [Patescibacteria group bacterium]